MPGYATLFDRLFDSPALFLAARCELPAKMAELGQAALGRHLAKNKIRYQLRTIDKVLTWAKQAANEPIHGGPMHHAIWTDLHELYRCFRRKIVALEGELAGDLAGHRYSRANPDHLPLITSAEASSRDSLGPLLP